MSPLRGRMTSAVCGWSSSGSGRSTCQPPVPPRAIPRCGDKSRPCQATVGAGREGRGRAPELHAPFELSETRPQHEVRLHRTDRVVTSAVALSRFQNLETVTVSFLTVSLTLPVSILVFVIYVLGMVTGSAALALLKSWIAGARRKPQ